MTWSILMKKMNRSEEDMERTGVFCGQTDTLPADQAGRVFLSEEEQMHKEEQMQLSPSQEQAVRHGSGPALVLAGPGSGKTFVITRRVACLIHEGHADPAGILVVTFSRAAARTMRKRYLGLTGNDGGDTGTPVVFGTFHSVFFQILKAAYHYTAANILKEEQRVQILRDLINGYRIEGNDRKELMENLSAEISRVKNEEIDLQNFYSSVTASDTFRQVFRSYQQALEAAENLKKEIESKSVDVRIKVGENGRVFGSVSTKEIAEAVKTQLGMELDKKKMILEHPIKELGTTAVDIRLHPQVTAALKVNVKEA